MKIVNCSKADFDQILIEISEFWENDATLPFHHPIFLYEFGNTAFVIKENGSVIAYLFGLFSQTTPAAYVHLIGVRSSHRRQGLGRRLYDHFIDVARKQGCREIKAITTSANAASIAFHRRIGMELIGSLSESDIRYVKDYSGPGQDRVVFRKNI